MTGVFVEPGYMPKQITASYNNQVQERQRARTSAGECDVANEIVPANPETVSDTSRPLVKGFQAPGTYSN